MELNHDSFDVSFRRCARWRHGFDTTGSGLMRGRNQCIWGWLFEGAWVRVGLRGPSCGISPERRKVRCIPDQTALAAAASLFMPQ